VTVHYLGAEVKPVQWRDGQAPELFLGHVAAQDTVRHGHRLLNLREPDPACVVGEWHRRDIRRSLDFASRLTLGLIMGQWAPLA
jgi:hypothetical protein